MKSFDYTNIPKTLLTSDIVAILTSIHEHKGKQGCYIEAHADVLTNLMKVAKIQDGAAMSFFNMPKSEIPPLQGYFAD